MIDFEREIEVHLHQFQLLTGKGNVKDCNHTLYEIIRLMLGMIRQQPHQHPSHNNAEKPCDPMQHEVVSSQAIDREVAPQITLNAPLGLTRFGNPKRDRSRKTPIV